MDNIDRLLQDIRGDKTVLGAKFSADFLNNAADVFEKHGFGTTKALLMEKELRDELKQQATALLKLLDKFEQCPEIQANRRIGRLIIKTLIALKTRGV